MTGPQPIGAAIRLVHQRVERRSAVVAAWPDAPGWFRDGACRLMLNPKATSDAFLLLADALEEMRRSASADGQVASAAGIERLRDLFREAAPERADVPLFWQANDDEPLDR